MKRERDQEDNDDITLVGNKYAKEKDQGESLQSNVSVRKSN
jgi:hypothetical protein